MFLENDWKSEKIVSWISIRKETNPLGDISDFILRVAIIFNIELSNPLSSNNLNISWSLFYSILWYLNSNLCMKFMIPSLKP